MSRDAPDEGAFRSANPEIAEQMTSARASAGEHFDEVSLALTLLLHRTTATLVRATHFDFEPLQMNTTQFNVMTVLHRAGAPMTMGALAESVSVRAPNLTSVVNSLRARKLVAKKPGVEDRRSFVVHTTTQGDALMRRFLPGHARFMREFYAGLDPHDQRALAELLDRLLLSLRPDGDGDESGGGDGDGNGNGGRAGGSGEHRGLRLPDRIVNAALSGD